MLSVSTTSRLPEIQTHSKITEVKEGSSSSTDPLETERTQNSSLPKQEIDPQAAVNQLTLEDLVKIFPHPSRPAIRIPILSGLSATFRRYTPTVIRGVSGSEKTTLLRIIRGLEDIDAGDIRYNNQSVLSSSLLVSSEFKQKVAYMDQFPEHNVLFELTALENIKYAILRFAQQPRKYEETSLTSKALAALERFGIHHLADEYPRMFSGGEMQRLALAIVTALDASVLLLDEPTSRVDVKNKQLITSYLQEYAEQTSTIVIVTTHDTILRFDTPVLELKKGRLYEK